LSGVENDWSLFFFHETQLFRNFSRNIFTNMSTGRKGAKKREREARVGESSNSNEAAAEGITSLRIVAKTRDTYESTFLMLQEQCVEHVPESVNSSGKLILPLSLSSWKQLIGFMTKPFPNGQVRSHSTVGGYISAIKNAYKDKRIVENVEEARIVDAWLKEFMQGYKRLIQDKRDKGIMKLHEGKLPVTYQTAS